MKLLQVGQYGYGTQSFLVSGNNSGAQTFGVGEGNLLRTIDMIRDMGDGSLVFGHGPEVRPTPSRDPGLEALLRRHD